MAYQLHKYIQKMPAVICFVVAVTIVTIITELIGSAAIQSLGLTPALMSYRQLHTMVTYAFVHAGFIHWFFNVCWILALGLLLESRIGSFRIGVLLIMGIISFSTSTTIFNNSLTAPMIGCSGVAYSLLAAYAITLYKTFKILPIWEKVLGLILVVVPLWNSMISITSPAGKGWLVATGAGVMIMFIYILSTRELIETE